MVVDVGYDDNDDDDVGDDDGDVGDDDGDVGDGDGDIAGVRGGMWW